MFRSMKYQNPKIREHLASQYAIGLLTPRVKARVEALMNSDESFRQEVDSWQETLSPLSSVAEPVPVPPELKAKIMKATIGDAPDKALFWGALMDSIRLWQGLAVTSLAAVFVISMLHFNQPSPVSPAKLSYIALMQSSTLSGEPPLIITAYGKTEVAPSRLELRWNERTESAELAGATLWAVARETGKIEKLASLTADLKRLDLTKQQWALVKNSLELVVTHGPKFESETLFKGTCVQLTDWT